MDQIINGLESLNSNSLTLNNINELIKAMDTLKTKLVEARDRLKCDGSSCPITAECEKLDPPDTTQLVQDYTSVIEEFLPEKPLEDLKKEIKSNVEYYPQAHPFTPKVALFGKSKYIYNKSTKYLQPVPLEQVNIISNVLEYVNTHLESSFNSVLINKYMTKNVALGYHRDDESSIVPNTSILTLSIGSKRSLAFRQCRDDIPVEQKMVDNMLLTMKPGCQEVLEHSVLKGVEGEESGVRYSLTFRQLRDPDDKVNGIIDNIPGVVKSVVPVVKSVSVVESICNKVAEVQWDGRKKNVLVVGSSLVREINCSRLVANQNSTCEVKYRAGAHLPEIISMLKCHELKSSVTDVVIVGGGNDVGNCGYTALPNVFEDFNRLATVLSNEFCTARVYIVGLMPRKLRDHLHLQRMIETNIFLSHLCGERCFRYLDRFSHYLVKDWRRCEDVDSSVRGLNSGLFKKDYVHHSTKGVSVLSKVLIGAIFHPR